MCIIMHYYIYWESFHTRTAPARTTPARTAPARTAPARTAPARTAPARTAPDSFENNMAMYDDDRKIHK